MSHHAERTVDPGPDLFRIKLVDETRVPDEVGEESRYYAAVTDLQTVGERLETVATVVAVQGAGGERRLAIGTEHRDLNGTPEF